LVFLGVSACHVKPRQAASADDVEAELASLAAFAGTYEPPLRPHPRCTWIASDADRWGSRPRESELRESEGTERCPLHVATEAGAVTVSPSSRQAAFDPVPWDESVPDRFATGTRRVQRVDDGWLVAYAGPFFGELWWIDENGRERRPLSVARIVGFAHGRSGIWLALAVGKARLGRGGVLALDHVGRGEYRPRLVAALPVEPSPAAYDDDGRLVGFAEGFVIRADERGRVENLHYFSTEVLHVTSIVKRADAYYLAADCGVVRLVPSAGAASLREEWWSANLARTSESLSCVFD
jgi:hypothetical protein